MRTIVFLLLVGCSTKSQPAKGTEPAAKPAEPAAAAAEPAAAPAEPAAAPTEPAAAPAEAAAKPAEPAAAAPKSVALAFLERLARSNLTIDSIASEKTFAFVDYAERPQGGRNRVERGLCGAKELTSTIAEINGYAGQLDDALQNDAVACDEAKDGIALCRARAQMEGEATLTYAVVVGAGAPKLAGFSRHETFMIDDDGAVTRDEQRRDRAFATLRAKQCAVASTR